MSDAENREGDAAEYVLGTLSREERAAIEALRHKMPSLDAAIIAWENRLVALNEDEGDAAPAADLFGQIERRIAVRSGVPGQRATGALEKWRVLALAASLAFVIAAVFSAYKPTPIGATKIALLQSPSPAPAFLVSVDTIDSTLTIRSLTAPAPPGKSYELWLIADKAASPKSLGIVPNEAAKSLKLSDKDASVISTATLAISVEPEGGSPTGKATGPVILTGKFL